MLKLAWACIVFDARPRCRVLLVSGCCCLGHETFSVQLARTFVEFWRVNCWVFILVGAAWRRILLPRFYFYIHFGMLIAKLSSPNLCNSFSVHTLSRYELWQVWSQLSNAVPLVHHHFFRLRHVLASVLVRRRMVERAAIDELKDLKSVHTFVIITTDIQKKMCW
jgi:hypothetical protein